MKALPMPYSSLPTQYVSHGEYVSEEIDLFARDQVLAIQKQAYEDGLRDAGKDAERYRWLRSRKSLELSSSSGEWTRIDGSKFTASHYLAEGGTQHGAAPSLDETIDSAMLVAMLKAKEQP